MKKKLIAALAAIAITATVQAQTNTATTFVNSVQAYFTQFNTNYSWTNISLEISSGYAQVAGVNAASKIYAQYDISAFSVVGSVQFSGVGSAINGGELGVGYTLVNHFDTKLEADLLGGYDNTKADAKGALGAIVVEPRISLKKKLSVNTYAETALSLPVYTVGRFNSTPTFYAGVGFTY